MHLLETFQRLSVSTAESPPEATIYARAPWTAASEAIIVLQPQDGSVPVVAAEQGLSYFLEVFIVVDFLADWQASRSDDPSLTAACERLIHDA